MAKQSTRWRRATPSLLERKWNDSRNKFWITRYSFDHTEYMPLGDSAKNERGLKDSNPHQLVWLSNLDYGAKKARKFIELEQYAFLDLGCGTGVPSIYAHLRLRFRKAGGFDIDERFVQWANENAERAGVQSEVSFEVADADRFVLPDEKFFLFFFNSFGEATLSSFLSRNRTTLEKSRSVLCLVNDQAASAVSSMPNNSLLFRSSRKNLSLFRFDALGPEEVLP